MNFQNIEAVKSGKFYLDVAIQRGKRHVNTLNVRLKDENKKTLIKEKARIKTIKDSLTKSLTSIVNSFPGLDGLPEFYTELCESTMNVDEVKKALSTISWAPKKIDELERLFLKSARGKNKAEILTAKKSFIGRTSSIIKRLEKKLELIENARNAMIKFPDIKEDLYTVCIAGFPNVGKSTLLSKITTSKPEIGSYAFTTTKLNTGYFKDNFESIQIIDVPGTLNRFEKMNNVEKQAHLAIKYLANLIIYIFDLTEPYTIQEQEALYEKTKEQGKQVITYFSKADILGEDKIKEYIKEKKLENATWNANDVKKQITQQKKQ